MFAFLLFSLLSGVLEVGILFLSAAGGIQDWRFFVLPLMYQMGNLLFPPAGLPPVRARIAAFTALGFLLADAFFYNWLFTADLVLFSSLCIQIARSEKKATCPSWLKRGFRILGFMASPLMVRFPALTLAVCTIPPALTILSNRNNVQISVAPSAEKTPYLFPPMVFHQMHYFVYAYMMPILFFQRSGSVLAAASAFALSWVVYLIPQAAVGNADGEKARRIFFICHSALLLCMTVMTVAAANGYSVLLFAAWMTTGLGGGSVFCIPALQPVQQKRDLTMSENLGHALGVCMALVLSWLLPKAGVAVLTGASVAFVCLTLLSGLVAVRKEEKFCA